MVGQSVLAEFRLMQQVAAAAVRHPGGRRCRVWPLDHGVEVRADGQHELSTTGIDGRTVRIVAGAVVLNLRLAIAVLGRRPLIRPLPASPCHPLLAILRQAEVAEPSAQERALFDAITPVARFLPPLGDRTLPPLILVRARTAAESEGMWLRSVDAPQRAALAARIARVRQQPLHARLVVIGSNHDVPGAHLRAGLALQRMVLTARVLGATTAVVAWPGDLAAAAPLPVPFAGRGVCPQLIVAIGVPAVA